MKKESEELDEGPGACIDLDSRRATLKKIRNWKMPDHDGIHGFWHRKSTSIHERLARQLSKCLQEVSIPEKMTKGKITLIQNDPQKKGYSRRIPSSTNKLWKVLSFA